MSITTMAPKRQPENPVDLYFDLSKDLGVFVDEIAQFDSNQGLSPLLEKWKALEERCSQFGRESANVNGSLHDEIKRTQLTPEILGPQIHFLRGAIAKHCGEYHDYREDFTNALSSLPNEAAEQKFKGWVQNVVMRQDNLRESLYDAFEEAVSTLSKVGIPSGSF